jgi:hypothetical protein
MIVPPQLGDLSNMNVENEVMPTSPDRIKEMMAEGPEGPIYMINLLKFKEKAEYEDGRATSLSGYEAYQIYANATAKLLPKFNGKGIFAGDVTFLALGQVEDLWDEVAIAMYAKRSDLFAMSSSKEWQEVAVHRTAGLAGQLNIETVAQPGMFES